MTLLMHATSCCLSQGKGTKIADIPNGERVFLQDADSLTDCQPEPGLKSNCTSPFPAPPLSTASHKLSKLKCDDDLVTHMHQLLFKRTATVRRSKGAKQPHLAPPTSSFLTHLYMHVPVICSCRPTSGSGTFWLSPALCLGTRCAGPGPALPCTGSFAKGFSHKHVRFFTTY